MMRQSQDDEEETLAETMSLKMWEGLWSYKEVELLAVDTEANQL